MSLHALLPLDGSAFSAQSVAAVCRLLDPARYRLTLLRVAPRPHDLLPSPSPPRPVSVDGWTLIHEDGPSWMREWAAHPVYATQIQANAHADLSAELRREQRRLHQAGFDVSLAVQFGDPAEEILGRAEAQADLIVMATHGRSGLRRVLMGSVAETVMRRASVPVMLVRSADSAPVRESP